jgi:hypothetical protein
MATARGVAHVEAALEKVEHAADGIGGLDGVDEAWRKEAIGKLSAASDLLHATMDRFYLKTRACMPFAQRCEEQARRLDGLLAELGSPPPAGAEPRLDTAIWDLVQAARTLDERSRMQGMAIT